MRYTIVTVLILGLCFMGIFMDSGLSQIDSHTTPLGLENVQANANSQKMASSAEVGNMSCAEAHALIRMKKNDENLRKGIWQLANKGQCPVLSQEAYLALQR